MKSHDPIRSEQRLLEALRAAETATLALRDYAAMVQLLFLYKGVLGGWH